MPTHKHINYLKCCHLVPDQESRAIPEHIPHCRRFERKCTFPTLGPYFGEFKVTPLVPRVSLADTSDRLRTRSASSVAPGSCNIAASRFFSMPSNRSHPSNSRVGVLCSRRNSPVMTRPTYGLPSPVQDLKPNNALACQLRALSDQQRTLSCQCRAFQVMET